MKPTTRTLIEQAHSSRRWAATMRDPKRIREGMAKHHRARRLEWGPRRWAAILMKKPMPLTAKAKRQVDPNYVNKLLEDGRYQ